MRAIWLAVLILVSTSGMASASELNIARIHQTSTQGASRLAVQGNTAYVAGGWAGMQIFDISTGLEPAAIGQLTNRASDIGAYAAAVAVAGTNAYVAANRDGLYICDVSDSANPQRVALIQDLENFGSATDVRVRDRFAYLANAGDGLRVYDISNATNPTRAGHLSNVGTPGSAAHISIAVQTLYLANVADSVRVIDISNPRLPVEIGHIAPAAGSSVSTESAEAVGNYLYLANYPEGLRIYDVTDPRAPRFVSRSQVAFRDHAVDVAVYGNYAVVSLMEEGILIYDVYDPFNPKLVGSANDGGSTYSVVLSGNLIFEANYYDGLCVSRMYPWLTIRNASAGIEMSWPSISVGFALEQKQLGVTEWTVTPETESLSSGKHRVLAAPSASNVIYRLHLD